LTQRAELHLDDGGGGSFSSTTRRRLLLLWLLAFSRRGTLSSFGGVVSASTRLYRLLRLGLLLLRLLLLRLLLLGLLLLGLLLLGLRRLRLLLWLRHWNWLRLPWLLLLRHHLTDSTSRPATATTTTTAANTPATSTTSTANASAAAAAAAAALCATLLVTFRERRPALLLREGPKKVQALLPNHCPHSVHDALVAEARPVLCGAEV
jgi:hypothetical protein